MICRLYTLSWLSGEFLGALADVGFDDPEGILIIPSFYFAFPGGEPEPCQGVLDTLPGRKFFMMQEDLDVPCTAENVVVLTVWQEAN